MMKIDIACRFTGNVLFSHEAENNSITITLEAAVKAGANLTRASLAGANLAGVSLEWANLAGANLARANLARANLAGANLAGVSLAMASLAGANLAGANLARACLAGANLDGVSLEWANLARANLARANLARANLAGANLAGEEKLIGDRPIFQIGPIGSRCAYLQAFITNCGVRIRAGCFFGSKEQFIKKMSRHHGENKHAEEYAAALELIDKHVDIWTPKAEYAPQTSEEKSEAA